MLCFHRMISITKRDLDPEMAADTFGSSKPKLRFRVPTFLLLAKIKIEWLTDYYLVMLAYLRVNPHCFSQCAIFIFSSINVMKALFMGLFSPFMWWSKVLVCAFEISYFSSDQNTHLKCKKKKHSLSICDNATLQSLVFAVHELCTKLLFLELMSIVGNKALCSGTLIMRPQIRQHSTFYDVFARCRESCVL